MIFFLTVVNSWERNEMKREPARRYRAVGEGVFSSVLGKFKSLLLGWDGSARFLFLFYKKKAHTC